MKKILILFVAAFAAASCLSKGSYSQTYMADVTFEFSDHVYTNSFKDSLYVLKAGETGDGFIYNQYPIFFGQKAFDGVFQGGFLMSYLKGEKYGALNNEPKENDAYRVNAPAGSLGSKTYAVFYNNPVESMMLPHDIEFGYKDAGAFSPLGCYVNNTTLVARKIKENFQDGDKLVLKATGTKHDGSTVSTSITLAEYTEAKDSVMYNWTAFPLSTLGAVDFIDFDLESTNPEVPEYFCLDGLLASIKIEY
jgi:hypothetical protein